MATYRVRQRLLYYEDFEVEAVSAEDAINLVNSGEVDGFGPEYLEATSTFILDETGIFALPKEQQPDNAEL